MTTSTMLELIAAAESRAPAHNDALAKLLKAMRRLEEQRGADDGVRATQAASIQAGQGRERVLMEERDAAVADLARVTAERDEVQRLLRDECADSARTAPPPPAVGDGGLLLDCRDALAMVMDGVGSSQTFVPLIARLDATLDATLSRTPEPAAPPVAGGVGPVDWRACFEGLMAFLAAHDDMPMHIGADILQVEGELIHEHRLATPPPAPTTAGEAICEELFERLAVEDPTRLLAMFPRLTPPDLTFAAETAGRTLSASVIVAPLLDLLTHPNPLVREGAVMGLGYHLDPHLRSILRNVTIEDPSPGVREAAANQIADDDSDPSPQPPEPACPAPAPPASAAVPSSGSGSSVDAASSDSSKAAGATSTTDPAPGAVAGAVQRLCDLAETLAHDHSLTATQDVEDLAAAARAEVEGLRERCETLAQDLVDLGALHLADEQTARNLQTLSDAAHRVIEERDAEIARLAYLLAQDAGAGARAWAEKVATAREEGRREGWDEGVNAAIKAWGSIPARTTPGVEKAAMLALLGACPPVKP